MTVLEEESGETKEERSFTNLYVKCFPPHFKEQDLSELFGGFGPIQAVKVMTDGRGRSFGFVNFEQHEDAKTCIQEMHRKDLRPRKEQKEAKRLEAEGKAPAVKFDVDGHPEHLLYVGRAQSKEERAAMFQKQYGDKGAPKGATPKGKGKGGGTVFYGNGKGGTETLPEQSVEVVQSSQDVPMPYSSSSSTGNGWSMPQQIYDGGCSGSWDGCGASWEASNGYGGCEGWDTGYGGSGSWSGWGTSGSYGNYGNYGGESYGSGSDAYYQHSYAVNGDRQMQMPQRTKGNYWQL